MGVSPGASSSFSVKAACRVCSLQVTLTILLVTLSTVVMYVIPDIILLNDPTQPTFVFYVMNLNKVCF